MRPFAYTRASSLQHALSVLAGPGGGRLLAGGTTLYDLMKLDVETPQHLVDITGVAGLRQVRTEGPSLRFGALATMSEVATDPVVARDYPVLSESLLRAASAQLRNTATVAGNLLQRTRCPYFRNSSSYACNKRVPGSGCDAQEGADRDQAVLGRSTSCTALYAGDWAVALVALDASVVTVSAAGERRVAIADLHRLPGDTPHVETVLAPDEVIVAIEVPTTAARGSTYHKVRERESYAFALASAAVVVDLDPDDGVTARRARVALGGVATVPWRASAAETALVGRPLDAGVALAAGRAAFEGAQAGRMNAFKIELGARTVADALLIAGARSRA